MGESPKAEDWLPLRALGHSECQEGCAGDGGGGSSESGPRRALSQMAQTLSVPVRLNGPTHDKQEGDFIIPDACWSCV